MDPVVTGVRIIGQGVPRAISGGSITQSIIHGGGGIICRNVITHVFTNSSEMTINSNLFGFGPLKSQTLVIAPLKKPFLTCDRVARAWSKIRDSRPEHSWIGTKFLNKHIWSGNDTFSVRSDVGELDKLDTAVQQSSTDERNTAPLQIEEGSLESIFPKIVEESERARISRGSSVRSNSTPQRF